MKKKKYIANIQLIILLKLIRKIKIKRILKWNLSQKKKNEETITVSVHALVDLILEECQLSQQRNNNIKINIHQINKDGNDYTYYLNKL